MSVMYFADMSSESGLGTLVGFLLGVLALTFSLSSKSSGLLFEFRDPVYFEAIIFGTFG